jgi:hypothetical protein
MEFAHITMRTGKKMCYRRSKQLVDCSADKMSLFVGLCNSLLVYCFPVFSLPGQRANQLNNWDTGIRDQEKTS